ncbi:fatty acid desaturase family protein [Gryllotalpicola ginsengisoli]|uniref:fatty acid desaturase family protein n=1 Tax=Gryllotalpicola ginsengisoli TaxID=444608 RepID=UPI0003B5E866|nr:acyl-CoA desaturase [Gryllotalpicola ginsengisoli]
MDDLISTITSAGLLEGRLGAIRATAAGDPTDAPAVSYTEVSRQVKAEGLLARRPGFYGLVVAALLVASAAVITGMVLLGESWFQLLLAAVLGLILTQFAFLAHEAAHRQILATGPANDRLGRFLGTFVIGMSYAWWLNKHNRHHANPNQVGKDPDIAVDTISFLEEDAARATGVLAWITRRQGYLFFPLLTFEGVNLHVTSFKLLFGRDEVKHRKTEIVLIAARFVLYFAALLWLLPPGMAAAFLGVQLAVFGVYMGASFAPNHKGMPIVPADARLDFFSKQVRTSRNIRGGWWATAMFGGLNYQVEHHLFPSMPRPHLSRARLIVRRHCLATGVPYTEATLPESYAIVIAYLNRVGLQARDPFVCPVVTQYRRA